MKIVYAFCFLAFGALLTTSAMADENATGGAVLTSETVVLGGPFDHGAGVGDASNSTTTALFTGGFIANQVRFTGTTTAVNAATWGNEADISITDPNALGSFIWQTTGPAGTYDGAPFDFDSSQDFTADAAYAGGIDPNGSWNVEFIDSFDDGAGADQSSDNVSMVFEEVEAIVDPIGNFTLGSLNLGDTASSNGELALTDIFDLYSFTMNSNGIVDIFTASNPNGFTGQDLDTEIALFDSGGFLLFENDDNATAGDTYSELLGLALTAGDYTVAVGGFNTAFADGLSVTGGAAVGDYGLFIVTAVPEPTTLGFLGLAFCGIALRRRK